MKKTHTEERKKPKVCILLYINNIFVIAVFCKCSVLWILCLESHWRKLVFQDNMSWTFVQTSTLGECWTKTLISQLRIILCSYWLKPVSLYNSQSFAQQKFDSVLGLQHRAHKHHNEVLGAALFPELAMMCLYINYVKLVPKPSLAPTHSNQDPN